MKKALNILVLTIFAFAILASCSPETPVKPTPDEMLMILRIESDFMESFMIGALSENWEYEGDPAGDFTATLKEIYQCSNGDKLVPGSSVTVSQNGAYISENLKIELKEGGPAQTLVASGPIGGIPDSLRLNGKLIDPTGIDMPDLQ